MAYTTARTWVAGELVTAALMNTYVRDNQLAIKDPPTDTHEADEGADWSTTSGTFTAIDATDLSLSITTTGGDIMITFCGNLTTDVSGNSAYFQVVVDGVGQQGDDGYIAEYLDRTAAPGRSFAFTFWARSVAAGAHTILITWKVSANTVTLYGGAGTANGDLHPQLAAREVS